MIRLGLIRHARTPWNQEKRIQGSTDIPLSPEGQEEAARWGEVLTSEPFDAILSSPLTRARETALILSDRMGIPLCVDMDLREQDFGDWEGQRITEIREKDPRAVEFQESRGWEFRPPGGESRIRVLERVTKAFERAAKTFENQYILVVTHQSVIKILIYDALKRTFGPDETPLLKDYCLHDLLWDGTLRIQEINRLRLK
ncbi:MAG: histidine phosphatase family protein [Desulfobacteraceae bacterium]|nr:histidine phosphatase family protein [Desulfobacteraceae bacterium]